MMGAYGPPAGFYRNEPEVRIDHRYCVGCMRCVEACPQQHALEVVGVGEPRRPVVGDAGACAGCGRCVRTCPTHAIGMFLARLVPRDARNSAERR